MDRNLSFTWLNVINLTTDRGMTKCYGKLGCLQLNANWFDIIYRPVNLFPVTRDKIHTHFRLQTRRSTDSERLYSNLRYKFLLFIVTQLWSIELFYSLANYCKPTIRYQLKNRLSILPYRPKRSSTVGRPMATGLGLEYIT